MAKLTKKQQAELLRILHTISESVKWLRREDVIIGKTKRIKTTTLDYENSFGEVICIFEKEIGNPMVPLFGLTEQLWQFIGRNG